MDSRVATILADTQILLWALDAPERLSPDLIQKLEAAEHPPTFSAISIWEIAIKANLPRTNLRADPAPVRHTLLHAGWHELDFTSEHGAAAGALPLHHGDPFDRALVAQAQVERLELVTRDKRLREYGDGVRLV
jgi:PIN domain nuclease of toxin-antitoxin system